MNEHLVVDHFNLTTLIGFLAALVKLAGGALAFDPNAFDVALHVGGGEGLALTILFLGGLSDMLGQSVVLFANRVRPRRFAFSLVMAAVMLVVSVCFWAGSIWLVALALFGTSRPFAQVLTIVALSHAPLLFGFLALLPYLGNIIYRLLRVWTFLALLVGVRVTFRFGFWQALLCCAPGWVLLELATRLPILKIKRLDNWLWRVTTGTPELVETEELADQLATRIGLPLGSAGDEAASGEKR